MAAETPRDGDPRPNFLLIVVDDLGYSDLGFMGSEIRTPNLDALVADGLLLTDFHVSPACSPTRAMLLTGADAHPAGLGTMWEEASSEQEGHWGYEGALSDRVVTVAELLRDAGYHTYLSGKWHLGRGPGKRPTDRGFERAFGPVHGGSSHFSDQLAMFFPGQPTRKAAFEDDGEPAADLPEDWFSSTGYTDRLMEMIESDRSDDRPFFAFAAYTAPHWPLQAPDDFIDRYRGVYDTGWDALRQARARGLVARGVVPNDRGAERLPFVDDWTSLTGAEQRRAARTMEVYAAMVEHLDHEIGRLLAWLDTTGERENTLVLFFSDNGAEGNPVNRIIDDHGWVERTFDNRLENIGRRGSYVFPGPGWAQASTAPFRLFKTFPSEGGTRTPAIIAGPGVRPGGFEDPRAEAFATVKDVAPTLLELAGVEHPGTRYGDRPVAAMTGVSMAPLLQGSRDRVHPADAVLGMELFGRRALRRGDWKAMWLYAPYGLGRWQLFDLARDPAETTDLASERPDVLQALLEDWAHFAEANRVILPAADAGYAREDPDF